MLKKIFAILLGLGLMLNVQAVPDKEIFVLDEQGEITTWQEYVAKLKANKSSVLAGFAAGVVIPAGILLVLAHYGKLGDVMLKSTPDFILNESSKTKKNGLNA